MNSIYQYRGTFTRTSLIPEPPDLPVVMNEHSNVANFIHALKSLVHYYGDLTGDTLFNVILGGGVGQSGS